MPNFPGYSHGPKIEYFQQILYAYTLSGIYLNVRKRNNHVFTKWQLSFFQIISLEWWHISGNLPSTFWNLLQPYSTFSSLPQILPLILSLTAPLIFLPLNKWNKAKYISHLFSFICIGLLFSGKNGCL